ncbi:DUF397 domain-containing protein [Streptomyces sp. CC210A]|uniref:DUF397 domain-containing protein n=1 Tax=Streptomyces sp. CC210A TaxID=2898184 RepID=UPI001F2A81DC|nr:DUF397 domain-containing protein [Streptomyces sp. CC210A]
MPKRRSDIGAVSWRKSSYSGGGGNACLEVADNISHTVPVRDSKAPARTPLSFTPHAWQQFVTGVRQGTLTA